MREDRNPTGRTPCKLVKWIEGNTQIIYDELRDNIDQIHDYLDISLTSVCDVSIRIDNFCAVINKCVFSHCRINAYHTI